MGTHRRTLLGNTLMFALPVINYSPNKENRQTSTLDISIKDPKESITFSSVMSELLKNTEIWEGENRTSSNFVSLEFSTEGFTWFPRFVIGLSGGIAWTLPKPKLLLSSSPWAELRLFWLFYTKTN